MVLDGRLRQRFGITADYRSRPCTLGSVGSTPLASQSSSPSTLGMNDWRLDMAGQSGTHR